MLGHLRHGQTGWARALAALALCAMTLRAVLPAGFMIAPAQNGRPFVNVRLCSDRGFAQVALDGASVARSSAPGIQHKTPHGAPHSEAPCVFAATAHLAAPVLFAPPALQMGRMLEAAYRVPALVRDLALAAPPPFATGPPAAY